MFKKSVLKAIQQSIYRAKTNKKLLYVINLTMKRLSKITILIIIVISIANCNTFAQIVGNFIDNRDSVEYETITIGEQIW